MISINNLTVAYGGFTLLNEINFHISESDKIGLVGKNGAGKSTILKLICGLQSPTSGKVAVPGGVKIGYLPQIMEHHRGRSVIDEAMTAFADMFALEDELERITVELSTREDYESAEYHDLIVKMNEVNDRLSYTRSDNPRVVAEKTLIENTKDVLAITSDKKKLIAIKGLENYLVIDTEDALVICPKDDKSFKDFISGIAMPDYEKYR